DQRRGRGGGRAGRPALSHAPSTARPQVAVAATEAEADELLTRLLSRFPGRGNRVEESGFHTSDGPRAGAVGTTGSTVHLVITPDEDDGEPLARDVFDTAGAA